MDWLYWRNTLGPKQNCHHFAEDIFEPELEPELELVIWHISSDNLYNNYVTLMHSTNCQEVLILAANSKRSHKDQFGDY